MATRKYNPDLTADPGFVPGRKKPRKRKRKKRVTKAARQKAIDEFNYKDRVKRMRGLFGDEFKASEGYDLRKFNDWTPQQKAKVTRYFRVIAPRITGDFVVKRYRRPDNLEAAIDATLQEKKLPGQTAAVFSVDPGEKLDVKIRRGKATVSRDGLAEQKLIFDKAAFLDDPDAEIERVLELTDANVFRIITGANKQNKVLTRSDIVQEIFSLIARYNEDQVLEHERSYEEWLDGLIAYPGTEKRTKQKVNKFVKRHKELVEKRTKERLEARKARAKKYTRRQLLKGR